MKQEEAKCLAFKQVNLLMEYIEQILSDDQKVNGEVLIDSAKADGEKICTFDIKVYENGFEKNLSTGITVQHCDILNQWIFEKSIERFMTSETMGVTKCYCIRGGYGMNMDGFRVVNCIGSSLKINFLCRGNLFDEQAKRYNNTLMTYMDEQKESQRKL